MTDVFLGCDFGATSGRVFLGRFHHDRIELEELHRFSTGMDRRQSGFFWDFKKLSGHLIEGLSRAADRNVGLSGIAIDSWGCDFGLLDEKGVLIGDPRAYRDPRCEKAMAAALQRMGREALFHATGTQFLPFNSVFQLYGRVLENDPQLSRARRVLFIPDLLSHALTGNAVTESTIASTSGMIDPSTGTWSAAVLEGFGLPDGLFGDIVPPGSPVGPLSDEIARQTGLGKVMVRATAGHDTACAVAASPARDEPFAYVSSGTWSLVGVESPTPRLGSHALTAGVTNEGGVAGRFRILKNVTGLWILEECRRAWSDGAHVAFDEIVAAAAGAQPLRSLIDPDHADFRRPPNMPGAIAAFCERTGQTPPNGIGETARCVLESLALAVNRALAALTALPDVHVERLHVVGGGSRNALLNQFTANATGLLVEAGPAEATSVGNVLVQAMAAGRLRDLSHARKLVARSFPTATFAPHSTDAWMDAAFRFDALRDRASG